MRHLLLSLALIACSAVSASAQVEIAYDDGTPEALLVWNYAHNGVAVRFSAPGSVLTGAKFFTYTTTFWNPVGFCVLDANGPSGAPGDTLLGYSEVPLQVPGAYQEVPFPTAISLPHADFYVVYLQTGWGNMDSNGFGVDKSSPASGRSWLYQNVAWSQMTPQQGNVMIRAVILQPTPTESGTLGSIKGRYR
jgi:bacillopeptidase F